VIHLANYRQDFRCGWSSWNTSSFCHLQGNN